MTDTSPRACLSYLSDLTETTEQNCQYHHDILASSERGIKNKTVTTLSNQGTICHRTRCEISFRQNKDANIKTSLLEVSPLL